MMMRNWESNGNDPLFKSMSEDRIRREVETRLRDISAIEELNKYAIDEHGRAKER